MTDKVLAEKNLIACPNCDALAERPRLSEGEKACCRRCGSTLYSRKRNSINRTLAVSIAGLMLVIPAMTLPIIGINLVGRFNEASMVDCLEELVMRGFNLLALCVFLFTFAIPIVRLITAFYISYSIKMDKVTEKQLQFFSSYHTLDHWIMLNVFLFGCVVSMYKIMTMADLTIGLGLTSLLFLLFCSALVSVTFDPYETWQTLEKKVERSNR